VCCSRSCRERERERAWKRENAKKQRRKRKKERAREREKEREREREREKERKRERDKKREREKEREIFGVVVRGIWRVDERDRHKHMYRETQMYRETDTHTCLLSPSNMHYVCLFRMHTHTHCSTL